ncbi:MAG: penicillin-binding protein activator [Acetobacter sp.]|nr:penicillin-binding protein activator [Acetobacter sp.]
MRYAYWFPKMVQEKCQTQHKTTQTHNFGGRVMRSVVRGGLKWVVVSCVILSDCANHTPSPPTYQRNFTPVVEAPVPHKIGVLLPLSGPNESLGRELLAGISLALAQKTANSPIIMDVQDTAGDSSETDTRVLEAVKRAVNHGDGFLLGPLTSAETSIAAPVATAAHVPMLSLTSDSDQARPGVWVMGITPEDQVQALVEHARGEGKQHFAALLPDNRLGHVMGNALRTACQNQNVSEPDIIYYAEDSQSIKNALNQLLAYETRIKAEQQVTSPKENGNTQEEALPPDLAAALGAPTSTTPQNPTYPVKHTADSQNQTTSSASTPSTLHFDTLLLGDTGIGLKLVMTALSEKHIGAPNVQIMGPGLWAAFSSKLGAIQGAWFAAPNPYFRQSFVARFMARYNHSPKPLADLSYDAALVARTAALGRRGQFQRDVLTRRRGFQGANGQFYLLPDGRVQRVLAIFEVQGLGVPAHVIATSNPIANANSNLTSNPITH